MNRYDFVAVTNGKHLDSKSETFASIKVGKALKGHTTDWTFAGRFATHGECGCRP